MACEPGHVNIVGNSSIDIHTKWSCLTQARCDSVVISNRVVTIGVKTNVIIKHAYPYSLPNLSLPQLSPLIYLITYIHRESGSQRYVWSRGQKDAGSLRNRSVHGNWVIPSCSKNRPYLSMTSTADSLSSLKSDTRRYEPECLSRKSDVYAGNRTSM